MVKFSKNTVLVLIIIMTLISTGCALFNNTGETPVEAQAPQSGYYYGVFEDVPIPNEMKSTKEGYIVYAPGNIKMGMDVYSGRVEINSLNNAIESYMANDGWSFYSGCRGPKQNALVFSKGNFLSFIITTDGSINTEMRIYVTQKIK
jgi:hypothetical protein